MSGKRKGTYYAPWPLDYVLLAKMPEIGTIGGVHWKGRQARDLVDDLKAEGIEIKKEMVTARLRSMHVEGLVKPFGASGGLKVWAKTPAGVRFQATEGDDNV